MGSVTFGSEEGWALNGTGTPISKLDGIGPWPVLQSLANIYDRWADTNGSMRHPHGYP